MPRSFKTILSCVFLVLFLAIGFGAAPVQANGTFKLTAFPTSGNTWLSDFALTYFDADNDQDFSVDELLIFSGVTAKNPWWNPGVPMLLTWLQSVPSAQFSEYTDAHSNQYNFWSFSDGTHGLGGPAGAWTYVQTGVVPIPPSVFLLGAGLIGLAGWRRLRKS